MSDPKISIQYLNPAGTVYLIIYTGGFFLAVSCNFSSLNKKILQEKSINYCMMRFLLYICTVILKQGASRSL